MPDNVNNSLQNDELLRVSELSMSFGGVRAVQGVSFFVGRGEVFGLVGESGSGKTTLGRSIMRLYGINDGEIYFRGQRISAGTDGAFKKLSALRLDYRNKKISEIEYKDLRSRLLRDIHERQRDTKNNPCGSVREIQMIFQDPIASLNPRITVGNAVAEGLRIQGVRDNAYINECTSRLLLRVGIRPEYKDRYPHEFSGGQRQRIGIARALIMNPELIIADEPVSALDVSVQAQVINLLDGLKRELGLTILFIAHDLSVVKHFSDRIGVMRAGRLVECAGADELFNHPCHPYTRALLSAIPLPDPLTERMRKRLIYDPEAAHDYSEDAPTLREICHGHFVLCNSEEETRYKGELS